MERARKTRSTLSVFLLGIVLGYGIWAASRLITGALEPWDARFGYYPLSLLLVGGGMGFLSPRRFWLWPMALYLGQCLAALSQMATTTRGGVNLFIPLGMVYVAMFSALSLVGASIGAALKWLMRRRGLKTGT
ncbi:MAG: hypothetical protein HYZ73_03825 [Elusimicrobia bacterium]|nr:hypothetical protein [Elusimicrobiota bacterium]